MSRKYPFLSPNAAVIVVLATASACGVTKESDSWLQFRNSTDLSARNWNSVPKNQIYTVLPSAVPEAIKLLTERPFIPMSDEQFSHFAGTSAHLPGMQCFLIRAVKNARAGGTYTILSDGRSVVVQHESLAKRSSWQDDAIIVALPSPPMAVYVEVSVAE